MPSSLINVFINSILAGTGEDRMKGQAGLWDVDERYARLSAAGDPLERLITVVAWEMFRKPLAKALNRPDQSQGGRPGSPNWRSNRTGKQSGGTGAETVT